MKKLTSLFLLIGATLASFGAQNGVSFDSVTRNVNQTNLNLTLSSLSVSNALVAINDWVQLSGQTNRLTIAGGQLLLDGNPIGGDTIWTNDAGVLKIIGGGNKVSIATNTGTVNALDFTVTDGSAKIEIYPGFFDLIIDTMSGDTTQGITFYNAGFHIWPFKSAGGIPAYLLDTVSDFGADKSHVWKNAGTERMSLTGNGGLTVTPLSGTDSVWDFPLGNSVRLSSGFVNTQFHNIGGAVPIGVYGFHANNPYVATDMVQQNSPGLSLFGQGWSSGDMESQDVGFGMYVIPTAGATPKGLLLFMSEINNVFKSILGVNSTPAAGETSLYLYDADNDNLEPVTVGAADSGGTGFKVLRIPN